METQTIILNEIERNEEGYLTDATQWNEEVAKKIAEEYNFNLTPKHFEVINWLRQKFIEDVPLSIRKVGHSGIVDIKQFYQLFPGGPLKVSSKIAGIPKPVSCI